MSFLIVEKAKELLGWTELETKVTNYLLTVDKKKIICTNNGHNRPFTKTTAHTYKQSILNRQWRLNGETIIIGSTGEVLSGQHRLVGLVLAAIAWQQDEHWKKKFWKTEPTIETVVAYGIDEGAETVRTIDNVRTRSGADTLYAESSKYFAKHSQSNRRELCTMTQNAVRRLWARTGASLDPWAPNLTNSNMGDFIERHPHILKAVLHIFEEYQGNSKPKLTKLMPPGNAAGIMYLMGSADSKQEPYLKSETRSEKLLNFDCWEKASEFWVDLVKQKPALNAIREKLAPLQPPADYPMEGYSLDAKLEVFAKAWALYKGGDKVTLDDLALEYRNDRDGLPQLVKTETFGGIDLGDPRESEIHDPAAPPPEEIAEKAKEIANGKGRQTVEYEITKNEAGDELVGIKPKPSKRKAKATA